MAITIKPNIQTKLAPSSLVSNKLTIPKPDNMPEDYALKVIVKYGFGEIISEKISGESKDKNIEFDLTNISDKLIASCGYQLFFFYSKDTNEGPFTISNIYLLPSINNVATLIVNNYTALFTYSNNFDPVIEVVFDYYPAFSANTEFYETYTHKINYDQQLDPSHITVTQKLNKFLTGGECQGKIIAKYTTLYNNTGSIEYENADLKTININGHSNITPNINYIQREKENSYAILDISGYNTIYKYKTENNANIHKIIQTIQEIPAGKTRFIDYNIEHNMANCYVLSTVTESTTTFSILIKTIDFDHYCLYDSEKQYIIKFNPKVNSFKETVQETKTDTIGGQYPIIFRNGTIKYKEFSIGGLISRLAENEEEEEIDREETPNLRQILNDFSPTDIIGENIQQERDYKLELLNWLNNGKPKVFKSPYEGNYIVRLMNVQLSPEETTSRMIHSFTANAVEVAEYNYENLEKYNLLKFDFE